MRPAGSGAQRFGVQAVRVAPAATLGSTQACDSEGRRPQRREGNLARIWSGLVSGWGLERAEGARAGGAVLVKTSSCPGGAVLAGGAAGWPSLAGETPPPVPAWEGHRGSGSVEFWWRG